MAKQFFVANASRISSRTPTMHIISNYKVINICIVRKVELRFSLLLPVTFFRTILVYCSQIDHDHYLLHIQSDLDRVLGIFDIKTAPSRLSPDSNYGCHLNHCERKGLDLYFRNIRFESRI
jgi:hypothetical protein